MPRTDKNVRPLYAQIPTALAKRVEKAMLLERRDKREIVILALTAYLDKPCIEAQPAPVPAEAAA